VLNYDYINKLVQLAKAELKKSFNFEDFRFNDFELINFFLINNALNQSQYSLSIQVPKKDDKRDFYIPVLLSVSATLFFQNYIDDKTCYEVGEIVQKEGKRFKIIEKNKDGYIIASVDAEKTLRYPTHKQIKKYIVTTANLTNRKAKVKFHDYQSLYKLLFNVDYVPSKFTYKSAIILEKADFFETLKVKEIPDIDLKKAIPFKWVSKAGIKKEEAEFIPVEPMIYLIPDYETFKQFVLAGVDKLDSVVFIGKNKYEPFITNIKRDIRTGILNRVIFIGSKEIEDFNDLKTWKWTSIETNYFENNESGTIDFDTTNPEEFLRTIHNFENKVKELQREYSLNLNSLCRLKHYLYPLVFASSTSRLVNQIEYVKYLYFKNIKDLLFEAFYEIDINPEHSIAELTDLAVEIFDNISYSKFDKLIEYEEISILIVPERFAESWNEDYSNDNTGRFPRNLKIMTFTDLKLNHDNIQTRKKICFLSIFGYKDSFYDIIKFIHQSPFNYLFILYPEEKLLAENIIIKCQNEVIQEFKSEDRFHLCKIEFPNQFNQESVAELIERIFFQGDGESKPYDYEQSETLAFQIIFEDDTSDILEGNRSVLLEKGNKRKEKISNLIVGDRIRVYENTAKEKLLEIAMDSDEEGVLTDIKRFSKLWKQCLIDFYEKLKTANGYNENDLLQELQKKGAKIQLTTLKKWLTITDKDMFPSQTLNLIAIKETINCPLMNDNFVAIKRYKKHYRSIMIALGRDLSDEIMEYIISGKKKIGKILSRFTSEQTEKIINASAPLKTIKSIKIIDSEENE